MLGKRLVHSMNGPRLLAGLEVVVAELDLAMLVVRCESWRQRSIREQYNYFTALYFLDAGRERTHRKWP